MVGLRNGDDVACVCNGNWIGAENIAVGKVARTSDHVLAIVVHCP